MLVCDFSSDWHRKLHLPYASITGSRLCLKKVREICYNSVRTVEIFWICNTNNVLIVFLQSFLGQQSLTRAVKERCYRVWRTSVMRWWLVVSLNIVVYMQITRRDFKHYVWVFVWRRRPSRVLRFCPSTCHSGMVLTMSVTCSRWCLGFTCLTLKVHVHNKLLAVSMVIKLERISWQVHNWLNYGQVLIMLLCFLQFCMNSIWNLCEICLWCLRHNFRLVCVLFNVCLLF